MYSEFGDALNYLNLELIREATQSRALVFGVISVKPLANLVTDYVYGSGIIME